MLIRSTPRATFITTECLYSYLFMGTVSRGSHKPQPNEQNYMIITPNKQAYRNEPTRKIHTHTNRQKQNVLQSTTRSIPFFLADSSVPQGLLWICRDDRIILTAYTTRNHSTARYQSYKGGGWVGGRRGGGGGTNFFYWENYFVYGNVWVTDVLKQFWWDMEWLCCHNGYSV